MTAHAGRGSISPNAALLILWTSLGAASGFLIWSARVEPAGPDAVAAALQLYVSSVLLGLLVSALVLGGLRVLRWPAPWLGFASYAAGTVYLGCGKALGVAFLPAVLLASAVALAVAGRTRWRVAAEPALVLAHVMGSVSALYLFFHLREFLAALPAFRDVLQAFWMLA